jgi:hypothetical protein
MEMSCVIWDITISINMAENNKYFQFLNRLCDITWFGAVYAK